MFTWYDYIELHIPNTTNAIDGHFADLKNKLRNHNGLNIERKKFIDEFLKTASFLSIKPNLLKKRQLYKPSFIIIGYNSKNSLLIVLCMLFFR